MSKFYIHIDDQQQGPFSIDELKELKITRETMVWFDGADNWKKATEVEDLQEFFKSVPPPFPKNLSLISPSLVDNKLKKVNVPSVHEKATKKKTTLIIVAVAVLLLGVLGTILYTNQLAQQEEYQRQLEEQNLKLQEQERIEATSPTEENVKIKWEDYSGREFAITAPSGQFTYGMIQGDNISYDFSERVSKVGSVYISYDLSGRVSKVGSVYISYDLSGRVSKVGGLYIKYNFNGKISGTSGSVN